MRGNGVVTSDILPSVSAIKKTKTSGKVNRLLRKIGFLTVSVLFRWLIWLFLGACYHLAGIQFFDYLFLVYPGTDSDLDGYCPRWLAKSRLFREKPVIAGVVSKGCAGRGLVLAVPNTAFDFQQNRDVCEKIIKRLKRIKWLVGAKSIALAGQMPGIIIRHGMDLSDPFVRGNKGTVFCISEAVRNVVEKHGLKPGKFQIAIVGVGYVGRLLMDYLEFLGHKVIGVDIKLRNHSSGVILTDKAPQALSCAKIVVVLTPKGSDFIPYLKYLKKGTIIVDDTHPKIRKRPEGFFFYKVAVGLEGVKFYPRLPGYKADWIPGCAVEAIVSAATGSFNSGRSETFIKKARELGFYAHLVN